MGRKSNNKGFGGSSEHGHYSFHPYSFDRAVLQLASIDAVKLTPKLNVDSLPDGTVVWELLRDYHLAAIQAIGEGWVIELTICTCCPGIKACEIRCPTGHSDRMGYYLQCDMDDWTSILDAIKHARQVRAHLDGIESGVQL